MKPLQTVILLSACFLLFSCKQHLFTQRKYTSGLYMDIRSSANRPAVIKGGETAYASLNKSAPGIRQYVLLDTMLSGISPKPGMPKDTVFILKKRGENKWVVKKDHSPVITEVIIKTSGNHSRPAIERTRTFPPEKYRQAVLKKLKAGIIVSNIMFWMPVAGLILAMKTRQRYRFAKALYPQEDLRTQNVLSAISVGLSILFFVALVAMAILLACSLVYFFLHFGETFSGSPL